MFSLSRLSNLWVFPHLTPGGAGRDRAVWFKQKFKEGQLIEGAIQDDAGKSQGTILLRVIRHESTDNTGHLFQGEFITAADQHYRWWMAEGAGKSLRAKCTYHSCEGNSHDCKVRKARKQLIHLEQFRVIGTKEWAAGVPDWAFKGQPKKEVEAFHLQVQAGKGESSGAIALPWAEAEGDDTDEDVDTDEE